METKTDPATDATTTEPPAAKKRATERKPPQKRAPAKKTPSTAKRPSARAKVNGAKETAAALPETQPQPHASDALAATLPLAVEPLRVPAGAPLDHPALYYNRELSWLDFNWRVFFQAMDARTPLLERVRFVAITANNLDEFYRKRIGGLKRQLVAGVRALSPDGRSPREQLDLVLEEGRLQSHRLNEFWEKTLRKEVEAAGVTVRTYESLSKAEKAAADTIFRETIFPILTPLAVDPGHPFPFISNLSLSLAFILRHQGRGTEHFARLKVPTGRGRWIPIGTSGTQFLPVEDLIRHNAASLFRGMSLEGVHAFRVTRNADLDRNEEEADDLLSMISEELRERKFANVVRLEVEASMPERVRNLLLRELELTDPDDLMAVDGLLDLASLGDLANVDLPQHLYLPWEPVVPTRLRHRELEEEPDIFGAIREGDILVHHPYESFAASTQEFLEEAAEDPSVLAIKLTLYRTSKDSPVVNALIRAAESGKEVAALIEVKARFDEANNIEWAQRLERAGAHVAYGLVGLKTHAKTMLVVREEKGRLRTYAHLGTGNYNPSTARFYTDFGLLTCREDLGQDLVHLFHFLTGYAPEQEYSSLAVAPRDLRGKFVELIRREIAHQKKNGNGRIVAKMNALDDTGIIRELYRASRAGVQIDLIVRGHTRMRPGLKGFSENVRIVSIVGRFLEHSRIFYFHNGGAPDTYIGSADWMRRNLDERVEVVVKVEDAVAQARLHRTLKFCLDDNRQAWDLQPDGRYVLRCPADDEPVIAFQDTLMRRARQRTEEDDAAWTL